MFAAYGYDNPAWERSPPYSDLPHRRFFPGYSSTDTEDSTVIYSDVRHHGDGDNPGSGVNYSHVVSNPATGHPGNDVTHKDLAPVTVHSKLEGDIHTPYHKQGHCSDYNSNINSSEGITYSRMASLKDDCSSQPVRNVIVTPELTPLSGDNEVQELTVPTDGDQCVTYSTLASVRRDSEMADSPDQYAVAAGGNFLDIAIPYSSDSEEDTEGEIKEKEFEKEQNLEDEVFGTSDPYSYINGDRGCRHGYGYHGNLTDADKEAMQACGNCE